MRNITNSTINMNEWYYTNKVQYNKAFIILYESILLLFYVFSLGKTNTVKGSENRGYCWQENVYFL